MKRNKICLLGVALGSFVFTGCSDKFLEDKKNYDKIIPDVFNTYEGAQLRVNAIYGQCLPDPSAVASWQNNCTGIYTDIQSKATEEYFGNGDDVSFVNGIDGMELSSSSSPMVPDYFQNEQKHLSNVWGRIRGINDAIVGFKECTLPENQKNEMLGQCYFFRAWCYYQLVKWYGGVPIISEVQEPNAQSFTQRSSAKACFSFILNDLDQSAKLLGPSTMSGGWKDQFGRVTTGTALALKGRVLMLWCSPMFNRKNDNTRWANAYKQMKQELDSIKACGYDLHGLDNPGINAEAFAKMFSTINSCEAVFVTLHNTIDQQADDGYNNQWERFIRPLNTQLRAGSGQEPSAMIVDLFPMKDGKKPKRVASDTDEPVSTWTLLEESTELSADPSERIKYPFLNRDPRFYRTFAFPGVRWAYNGDASQGGQNKNPADGPNYALWNYVWYTSNGEQTDKKNSKFYGADNLLSNARGLYVRKRSDDLDVNKAPLYVYASGASNGAFTFSAAPYMEIRFAEVLLNLAEAACGSGHPDEAVPYLKLIRQRVGYTGDCGLQSNLSSDQAACMSAILYERMIELAYEGKRFDDMRRWMLFDGGAESELNKIPGGCPATWKLENWGGGNNICTWLGYTKLNGQKRMKMHFRTNNLGTGTKYDDDPLLNVERCAPIDLRKDLYEIDATTNKSQLDVLKDWYFTNLTRVNKSGDAWDGEEATTVNFRAKYYFLGLSLGAQNRNDARLSQTIGWEDNRQGGMGTFDPLAE